MGAGPSMAGIDSKAPSTAPPQKPFFASWYHSSEVLPPKNLAAPLRAASSIPNSSS